MQPAADQQVTIKEALRLADIKNYIGAFNTLKAIANVANPHICLYAADLLHKHDKQQAYLYLLAKWDEGVTGALHRLVLLKQFFNPDQKLTQDDILLLEKESIKGNVESTLVLYMLHEQDNRRNVYCQRMKAISIDLSHSLDLTESSQQFSPEYNDVLRIINGEQTTSDATILDESINLTLHKNVFSPMFCRYIQLRTESLLAPAMIVNPITGKGARHPIRNSLYAQIAPELLDWFFLSADRKIAELSGVAQQNGEPLVVLNYQQAHEYKPHYDGFVMQDMQSDDVYADGGQRTKTFICGLSEASEGGETAFPKLKINVKLQAGDIVSFDNVDHNNQILTLSYHAGLPVVSGDKWIMTKWLREQSTKYGKMVYSA